MAMHTRRFNAVLFLSYLFCSPAGWPQDTQPDSGARGRTLSDEGKVKSKRLAAIVAGQAIYEDEVIPSVEGQLLPLRNQEYEIKKRALDSLIEQKLLEAAAEKKTLSIEELLKEEVDDKVPEATDAELQAYYLGQKDKLNRPFDEIKSQLRHGLKQAKAQQARQKYLQRLWADADIDILLEPFRVEVAYDPARLRGSPKAPVMIVEFSDFQCPFCRAAEPTLKGLLTKYGEKISLSYRDFPLAQGHPQAQPAAEASRCAGEQGKFWEYHDQLFNVSKLDRDALLEYARMVKLDEKQFDSCLASGKYKAGVQRDLQDGTHAGISGTPGFFINGTPLTGAQPMEKFVRIIDQEIGRKRTQWKAGTMPE